MFQSGQQIADFIEGFLVFLLNDRIGYYAATGPAVYLAFLAQQGANGDAGIHTATAADVAD